MERDRDTAQTLTVGKPPKLAHKEHGIVGSTILNIFCLILSMFNRHSQFELDPVKTSTCDKRTESPNLVNSKVSYCSCLSV